MSSSRLVPLFFILLFPIRTDADIKVPDSNNNWSFSTALHAQQLQEELKIGVLQLSAENVTESECRTITERLRFYLRQQGIFQIIDLNKMASLLDELGFQENVACNNNECVVQVGNIIGASKMVAGSVSKIGNLYSLQVRLIDVENSMIEDQAFVDEENAVT